MDTTHDKHEKKVKKTHDNVTEMKKDIKLCGKAGEKGGLQNEEQHD
jgi:hypothetical protein